MLVFFHTKHLTSVTQKKKKKKESDGNANATSRIGKQLTDNSHCSDTFPPEIMENLERSFKSVKGIFQSASQLTRRPQNLLTPLAQYKHITRGKDHLLSLQVLIF